MMKACVKDRPSKRSCMAAGHDYHVGNILLDDDVLSQIFARLPLEEVVRTSILSKGWNFRWTSFMYKLDIHDRHREANPQSFDNFLNTALPSLQRLRIFQLCSKEERVFAERTNDYQRWISAKRTNDYQRWISAALEHNLEILIVELHSLGFILPCSTLLNSTSLRQLSFEDFNTTLRVDHMKNIAPNLTQLQLKGINVVSGNPSLTFTFPVLETLTLKTLKWLNVKSVEINAPSLTAVMSAPYLEVLPSGKNKESDYSIVIVAPRVNRFYCGEMLEKITVTPSPSSVVSASLFGDLYPAHRHVRKQARYRFRKLLNEFTSLEELSLDCSFAKKSRIAVPLCRHDKLRRLTLEYKGSPKILLELLHAAPSLNFLRIGMDTWCDYNYEALECIPACIASHLEEVVFDCFFAHPAYDLAKFIFKNAVQLKKFRIFTAPRTRKSKKEIINRLSTMPRCSTSSDIIQVVNSEYRKRDPKTYFMASI